MGLATLLFTSLIHSEAYAFALIDPEGDGNLANLSERPDQFVRYEDQVITWKMDSQFRAAFADPYSRYLVRETFSELQEEAAALIRFQSAWPMNSHRESSSDGLAFDLRTVLVHELGHALGLQHPDAAAYNESQLNPGSPYNLNFFGDPLFGSQLTRADTQGWELMNEGFSPVPGQKGGKGIAVGEYSRVLTWDESLALVYAYGGSLFDFQEVGPDDDANITLTAYSNPGNSNLGQAGPDTLRRIDDDDVSKGWDIVSSSVTLNAGKPIAYNSRKQLFSFTNHFSEPLQQIDLVVRGTSTEEPVSAASTGAHRFQKGVRTEPDVNPEIAAYTYSEPLGGGVPQHEMVSFDLELDVDDWYVEQATGSTEIGAFDLPMVEVAPKGIQGLAIPTAPSNSIPSDLLPHTPPISGVLQIPLAERREPPKATSVVPSIEIVSHARGPVHLRQVELFPLRAEYILNGGEIDDPYLERLVRDEVGRSLALYQTLEPGETVRIRLTDLVPNRHSYNTSVAGELHLGAATSGPVAIRVTTSNEHGVLRVVTLAGVPQGLPNLDSLCGIYASALACCPIYLNAVPTLLTDSPVAPSGRDSCITGTGGSDTVVSALDPDRIQRAAMGEGNDLFRASAGLTRVFGGPGADLLIAGRRGVLIAEGGAGADVVIGSSVNDTLRGGADRDVVIGGRGGDRIYGGAGSDSLWGGSGNDEIFPGGGTDFVWGGRGDDRVVITACAARDTKFLFGGAGDDTLVTPDSLNDFLETGTQIRGFENVIEGGSFGLDEC